MQGYKMINEQLKLTKLAKLSLYHERSCYVLIKRKFGLEKKFIYWERPYQLGVLMIKRYSNNNERNREKKEEIIRKEERRDIFTREGHGWKNACKFMRTP